MQKRDSSWRVIIPHIQWFFDQFYYLPAASSRYFLQHVLLQPKHKGIRTATRLKLAHIHMHWNYNWLCIINA